jgi:hypothetical protein
MGASTDISVGTFNLNHLFSRFNFQGAIDALAAPGASSSAMTIQYEVEGVASLWSPGPQVSYAVL